MGIGLIFQAFGLYGFASNYDEGVGVICAILSIVTAIFHFVAAGFVLAYGYDPIYYEPIAGDFLVGNIPGFMLASIAAFMGLLIMMALVGVLILLLGESFTPGMDNRVIAVVFIGAAALMPLSPLNIFIEMILLTVLFLNAGVPKEWKKIEFE
jgi:hypothetical protein